MFEETGIKVEEKDLILINTLSGEKRKRNYPNGDIVYNNSSLYLIDVPLTDLDIKTNAESKRLEFFDIDNLPSEMYDDDEVEEYIRFISGGSYKA